MERHLDDMASGRGAAGIGCGQGKRCGARYMKNCREYSISGNRKIEVRIEEKRKIQELISDISHQTKTPIANMKMYLELFAKEGNLSGRKSGNFFTRITRQTGEA